jgi:hypothetical protein
MKQKTHKIRQFYSKHQDVIEISKAQLGILVLTFMMIGGF